MELTGTFVELVEMNVELARMFIELVEMNIVPLYNWLSTGYGFDAAQPTYGSWSLPMFIELVEMFIEFISIPASCRRRRHLY